MAYAADGILGLDLTATPADADASGNTVPPPYNLGAIVRTNNGFYQHVHASGAIGQYDFVKINDDFEASSLTTTISGTEPTAVGCAQVAAADDDYLWVFIGCGTFEGNALNAVADGAKVATTGTAGQVDDVTSGHDLIQGLVATEAVTGGSSGTFWAAGFMKTNSQD